MNIDERLYRAQVEEIRKENPTPPPRQLQPRPQDPMVGAKDLLEEIQKEFPNDIPPLLRQKFNRLVDMICSIWTEQLALQSQVNKFAALEELVRYLRPSSVEREPDVGRSMEAAMFGAIKDKIDAEMVALADLTPEQHKILAGTVAQGGIPAIERLTVIKSAQIQAGPVPALGDYEVNWAVAGLNKAGR